MTEGEKLAYLAGLIDGEGTITILKDNQNSRNKKRIGRKVSPIYTLAIQLTNTVEEMVDWCAYEFGGDKQISGKGKPATKQHGVWKASWKWKIGARPCYKLLILLLPYLRFKKDQAELGIEFYRKCFLMRSNGPVPVWLAAKREEYFEKIKAMHH